MVFNKLVKLGDVIAISKSEIINQRSGGLKKNIWAQTFEIDFLEDDICLNFLEICDLLLLCKHIFWLTIYSGHADENGLNSQVDESINSLSLQYNIHGRQSGYFRNIN